jgi:CRP-like cAMP-binding protein
MPANGDPLARFLLKLRARDEVSAHEEQVLRDACDGVQHIPAGRPIVRAGGELSHSTLVVEGFLSRYKDLSRGRRQIQEVHVPGDFTDLHGFVLKHLDHNVGTLTAVRIATFPHDRLRRITENEPHLSRLLWFMTLIDASIQRATILSVGRRTAVARIAHLLCELYLRLEVAGLAAELRFALPLTQIDIGDATGLTSIHVNRMLKELREAGIATVRDGEAAIHDWPRLAKVAEFDPAYLYLERRPH